MFHSWNKFSPIYLISSKRYVLKFAKNPASLNHEAIFIINFVIDGAAFVSHCSYVYMKICFYMHRFAGVDSCSRKICMDMLIMQVWKLMTNHHQLAGSVTPKRYWPWQNLTGPYSHMIMAALLFVFFRLVCLSHRVLLL